MHTGARFHGTPPVGDFVTDEDPAISDTEFTGAGSLSDLECDREAPVTLGEDEVLTCTATYVWQQEDVDNGSVRNGATVQDTPPGGGAPITGEYEEEITSSQSPLIDLVKTADPASGNAVDGTVTYTFAATNIGDVTLSDVAISEEDFSGTGALSALLCASTTPVTLAPGEVLTCAATYVITRVAPHPGVNPSANAVVSAASDPSAAPIPLPQTGSDVAPMLLAAALMLVAGVGLVRGDPSPQERSGLAILHTKEEGHRPATSVPLFLRILCPSIGGKE